MGKARKTDSFGQTAATFPALDRAKYDAQKSLLDRVLAVKGKAVKKAAVNINLLQSVAINGADATYEKISCRKRSAEGKQKAGEHLQFVIESLNKFGAAGMFVPSAGRAGDFLINYSRGEWAERILGQGLAATGEYVLLSYGPSTPPMPGEEDFRAKIGIFGLITALEGKRPDGLLFDAKTFGQLDADLAELTKSGLLASTPEDDRVKELIRLAVCAVEVKSSVWLAKKRDEGTISVTLKEEEVEPFNNWQDRYKKPIIFAQVFFDSVCLLNYITMKKAIAEGTLDGFPVEQLKDRKTKKITWSFRLARSRFFADVPFPDKSEAHFMRVGAANVAPYILYKGDPATNLNLPLLRKTIAAV